MTVRTPHPLAAISNPIKQTPAQNRVSLRVFNRVIDPVSFLLSPLLNNLGQCEDYRRDDFLCHLFSPCLSLVPCGKIVSGEWSGKTLLA